MCEDFEVLSAVLDGEVVDIEALEIALEDPGGRRVFVDFVRLRQAAGKDTTTPHPEFYKRLPGELTLSRRIMHRRIALPLAAAAILVALLLGSLLNPDRVRPDRGAAAPPEPARVLRFEPGVDWHP